MALATRATPAMGWNSWNSLRCHDLTEDAVLANADALVRTGLRDLGYDYVVVDDCWQAGRRRDGRLIADPARFPSGMAALGDELRRRGLRLGLYLAPGRRTCAQVNQRRDTWRHGLGSYGYEEQDLTQLLEWGVEYLKLDWCLAGVGGTGLRRRATFTRWSRLIDAVAPEIVFSISDYGFSRPWTWAPEVANSWRTTGDIFPRWRRVLAIARSTQRRSGHTRPGRVNDPDMLEVGNGELVGAAGWSHLAMWAMLAAPLMIGVDLRRPDAPVATLADAQLIRLNQDPDVRAGRIVERRGGVLVWERHTTDGPVRLLINTRRRAATVDGRTLPGRGGLLLR